MQAPGVVLDMVVTMLLTQSHVAAPLVHRPRLQGQAWHGQVHARAVHAAPAPPASPATATAQKILQCMDTARKVPSYSFCRHVVHVQDAALPHDLAAQVQAKRAAALQHSLQQHPVPVPRLPSHTPAQAKCNLFPQDFGYHFEREAVTAFFTEQFRAITKAHHSLRRIPVACTTRIWFLHVMCT